VIDDVTTIGTDEAVALARGVTLAATDATCASAMPGCGLNLNQ
jgi:hypothetical protein